SQEPFATTGLPIFSQRFRDPKWKTIHTDLIGEAKGFGKIIINSHKETIVRVVEVVECTDMNCDAWEVCKGYKIPKVPYKEDDEDPVKCNTSILQLKEIKLEKDHNDVKLVIGDRVRVIPSTLEGKVNWKVNQSNGRKNQAVQMLNKIEECDRQVG
ncbi:hypothetical protein PENTCL1PPCAC_839, partial [Pristionchus entomophagus]